MEGGDGDCGVCLDGLKELSSVCVGLDLSNKIHQLGTFVAVRNGEEGSDGSHGRALQLILFLVLLFDRVGLCLRLHRGSQGFN